MKTRSILILSFVITFFVDGFCQKDTTIQKVPFYWTFEFSSNALTSSQYLENHKRSNGPAGSLGFYINWDFPLNNNRTIPKSGLSIAPGIGVNGSTFSINKILTENNGIVTITNPDTNYAYSYIQGVYLEFPLDFRYLTPAKAKMHNYSFELGGKVGRLFYTEKGSQVKEGNDYYTYKTKYVGIMSKYRYGIDARIGYRKLGIGKDKNQKKFVSGFAISLVGSYYFSDTFIDQSNIACNSYSFGVGVSYIFN